MISRLSSAFCIIVSEYVLSPVHITRARARVTRYARE
jgi:hypothetical protein